MKTRLRLILAFVLPSTSAAFYVAQPSSSFAQGTAFTYQGRLNDGASAAYGVYDFTFSLFGVSSGGSAIAGPVTNSTVGVTNGLFTTTLDLGANFPGADRWLEIGVRTNATGGFTTLSPRQRLIATPYAITASNLTGNLPASQLTGTIPAAGLSGTYSGAVTFSNAANSFTGNGTGLTNVNAAALGGLTSSSLWQLGGNNISSGQFLGSTNDQPVTIKVNGIQGLQISPTANDVFHSNIVNIAGGSPVNLIAPGVYGAVIAGGGAQNYNGTGATNSVSADFGVIGGGGFNTIQANANVSTIGGGAENTIQSGASHSTIGGGYQNNIQTGAFYSAIGGGQFNTIQTGASRSTIGGYLNTNSGRFATVPGGDQNVAGTNSFAAGHRAKATHTGSFVWADATEADFATTAANQFLIRASGGVGIGTNAPVSALHVNGTVTASAFSGSGSGVTALNAANVTTGTLADARLLANVALLDRSLQAFAGANTFAGPVSIGTTALSSTLRVQGSGLLGELWISPATAGGNADIVLTENASGTFGMKFRHNGANNLTEFIGVNSGVETAPLLTIGRGSSGSVTVANNLTAGGSICASNGVVCASDRDAKENFAPVNVRDVLEKVAQLPLSRWNYKTDPGSPHLGPVAQDFHAAFGVGTDDRHIATVDADGVALAAIQGLNQKVESGKRKAENQFAELKAENAELKHELARLKEFVQTLNHQLNGGAR